MKKLVLIISLTGLFQFAFGQEVKTSQTLREDLIRQSDTQFKAGLVFLGGGTALAITALALPNYYLEGNTNRRARNFLGWTGILSISTSIPLFLSAGNNGRTAAKLSLQSQAIHTPLPSPLASYPSLSLKIPL
jgi:hypothetical protein